MSSTDFSQYPDLDLRIKITHLILELHRLTNPIFKQTRDPLATYLVLTAVAHGSYIDQPFTVSKIADIVNMSRKRVYTALEDLTIAGMIEKNYFTKSPYPVYLVKHADPAHAAQITEAYAALERLLRSFSN